MLNLNNLLNHSSEWLKGTGPNSDIVISSRIRLARNLAKFPFPHWANKKQSEAVLNALEEAAPRIDYLKNATIFRLADLDSIDKQFLVERHLMSLEHAKIPDHKAVMVEEEEILSIMINEEDHLRCQVMQSGFNLFEAWNIINIIDDGLSR